MKRTAMEVYQAFGQGMMSGTDSWKAFIAEDISFTGPVDKVKGKADFIALNEAFMPTIRGNSVIKEVESGDWVITQLEMKITMNSGKTITLDMCEWYEIRDEKIQSMKIYYDAQEFREAMGMKN